MRDLFLDTGLRRCDERLLKIAAAISGFVMPAKAGIQQDVCVMDLFLDTGLVPV